MQMSYRIGLQAQGLPASFLGSLANSYSWDPFSLLKKLSLSLAIYPWCSPARAGSGLWLLSLFSG